MNPDISFSEQLAMSCVLPRSLDGVKGCLPCHSPSYIVLSLPVYLSAPVDVKVHGSRDNDHLVHHVFSASSWHMEVPNKHLFNEYIIEITTYFI